MTWIAFARLMKTIYGPTLPDIRFIESLGLLAVKIGQTYALRPDFLREESCRRLAQLYRHTDRMAPADLNAVLADAVDESWRQAFASIDPEPLASASVGQVHRAELTSGDAVVVKVVKGEFEKSFMRDVRSLRRLLKTAIYFYPKLARVADPLGILESIETNTLSELDLRREAEGQQTLRRLKDEYQDRYDLQRLVFPSIHSDLSGRRVMVSEFIDAPSFDELLEQGALPYETLLELFHIHGFYQFGIGAFHGDIHPGNILLDHDRICLVDTGAISTVGDHMRRGLFGFFEALVEYDYEASATRLNEMAEKPIDGNALQRFRERFLDLYADFRDATVSDVSLTRRMMQTIKLGVHSGMVFEKGMYPIIKSLMYLDGMVIRCKPDAVLMHDLRRFVREFRPFVQ